MSAEVEVVQKRSPNSKTYALGNNVYRCDVSRSVLHFTDDDGTFKDVDPTPIIKGDTVVCESTPYKFSLIKGEIGYVVSSREGGSATLRVIEIGGKEPIYSDPIISKNRITFSEISPSIDLIIELRPNDVKTFRIIKSADAVRKFTWNVITDDEGLNRLSIELTGNDANKRELELSSRLEEQTLTEIWTGRTIIKDPKTRIKSYSDEVTYPVTIDPTFSAAIGFDADDGYEVDSTSWAANKNWDYLGKVFGASFNTGWRFRGVTVPQAATISSATLTLWFTDIGYYKYGGGTVYGAAANNQAVWSSSIRPSTVTKTSASATLTRPSSAPNFKVVTVTSIVQEIVNRAGWVSGNAMSLFALTYETVNQYASRFADFEYGDPSKYGTLSITYTSGGPTSYNVTASDSPSSSSTITRLLVASRTLSDSLSVTSPIADIVSKPRTISDTPSILSNITRLISEVRTITDSVSTIDSITRSFIGIRTTNDSPTIIDTVTRLLVNSRTLSDSPLTSSSITRLFVGIRSISDSPILLDSLIKLLLATRIVTDSVSTSDSVTQINGKVANISDSPSTASSITRIAVLSRTLDDTPNLTDSIVRLFVGVRTLSDSPSTSSQVTATGAITIIVAVLLTGDIQRFVEISGMMQHNVILTSNIQRNVELTNSAGSNS